MLKNNEITDIIKVIRSIETRGILSKGTTGKVISQNKMLINLLAQLIRVGLQLMKKKLAPLFKKVLIPWGSTTITSETKAAIQKKNFGLRITTVILSNEEMDNTIKIVKSV